MSESTTAGIRPRAFWAAALLALITPGLGLIYCGRQKVGFAVLGAAILFWLLNPLVGLAAIKIFLVLAYLLFYIVQIAASAVLAFRTRHDYRLTKFNRVMVYALIFMLFAAYNEFDSSYLTEISAIPTSSMSPSLDKNDLVILNKLAYGIGNPIKGDVVAYRHREDSQMPFIGRVIAGPGDEVVLRDNHYYVNGNMVTDHRQAIPIIQAAAGRMLNVPSLPLKEDEYYIAGDSPEAAYDSRFTGPVARDGIVGRIDAVLYSTAKRAPLLNASP